MTGTHDDDAVAPHAHEGRGVAGDEAEVAGDEAEPSDVGPIPAISDPVATARRRHGAAGAMLAAGMFGVDVALGRKPKEEAPVVIAASDEPIDIDAEGIVVPVDEHVSVVAPPQPRPDPFAHVRRHRRTRRDRS